MFAAEPEEEFRAVWLTTFAGLDWPHTYDPEKQKSSLLEIIDRLHAAHFNAIMFQTRSRGDAFYKSSFEPWARELTGVTGQDPGWDPLAFLIKHAHKRGIEVHAWFNVYKIWGAIPIPYDREPAHILESHPGWARLYGDEWWLDPGEPGVHTYLMKVALDLVERYPVDGIHFDHIRYPGRDFDDEIAYRRFGDGKDIHQWRRDNITLFVREFYKLATAIRPELKIGSAPIGVYRSVPGFSGPTAYFDYYQDPEQWLREGIHDYIVPQVYWNIAHNPKFDIIMSDWTKRAHGRHIYGGIGIFRPEISSELYFQISVTRALGISGQVLFRYNHLGSYNQTVHAYSKPVAVPGMRWKKDRQDHFVNGRLTKHIMKASDTTGIPEWLPAHVRFAVKKNNSHNLLVKEDRGSDSPQRYIIYRSDKYPINTNNPDHLLAVLPATTASFTDEIYNPASSEYHYLVTTLNGHDGEPEHSSSDKIDEIARILNREIVLPFTADQSDPDLYHLTFYMQHGATSSVRIIDEFTGRQYPIIEGFLDAGYHTISVPGNFTEPFMLCVMQIGDRVTERLLRR